MCVVGVSDGVVEVHPLGQHCSPSLPLSPASQKKVPEGSQWRLPLPGLGCREFTWACGPSSRKLEMFGVQCVGFVCPCDAPGGGQARAFPALGSGR